MNAVRWAITGFTLALAGYAANASATDPAAVLQQTKGRVFVGQATTMTPARQGMPLFAGNRVVATTGGSATITYLDGCTVTVAENSLLAISGPGQCKAGQAIARMTGRFQNPRIGQAPPAGGQGKGPNGSNDSDDDDDKGGLFGLGEGATAGLGFLVVAGIGIAASSNDDDEPVSP